MQKRNFNILVASICIIITSVWLTAYNVVSMGIDPIEYIKNNNSTTSEEDNEIIITIKGNVKKELELTLSDIKSNKYKQITAVFNFKNSYGTESENEYTGTTLWSILITEGILNSDSSTFLFIGKDRYTSPTPLSIKDVAKDYENQVILAYEQNNVPITDDGPVRSVIDREVIDAEAPGYPNSQFSVKNLKYIEIE